LERLIALPLAGEPRPRELAQFVVHFRQQLAGGAGLVGITRSGCHRAAQL
jgi:hypothetical protein